MKILKAIRDGIEDIMIKLEPVFYIIGIILNLLLIIVIISFYILVFMALYKYVIGG